MKTFIGIIAALSSTSSFAMHICQPSAIHAALAIESISQGVSIDNFSVRAPELISTVRTGGDKTYTFIVTTRDNGNDGFSRYQVELRGTSCLVQNVTLVTQD